MQAWRAFAVFSSELMLWLTAASFFEIIAVLGAGLLCILTAGYLFEGMKKHPLVAVLGGIVALTGTFLMFREVRSMIWPDAPLVAQTAPAVAVSAPVSEPPASARTPGALTTFSDIKPSTTPTWPPPSNHGTLPTIVISTCPLSSQQTCSSNPSCYWSLLTNSCQQLLGARQGLGAATAGPSNICWMKTTMLPCIVAGCRWENDICSSSTP